jgi:hypothetical protein
MKAYNHLRFSRRRNATYVADIQSLSEGVEFGFSRLDFAGADCNWEFEKVIMINVLIPKKENVTHHR